MNCQRKVRHRRVSFEVSLQSSGGIGVWSGIWKCTHYNDVIMSAMASQITSLMIVYSSVYSDADQRKHQSSASLAFLRGIRRWPVISPHKRPVTRKMSPFDDVIMNCKPEDHEDFMPWQRFVRGSRRSPVDLSHNEQAMRTLYELFLWA